MATNFGLDWPSNTLNPELQKKQLREIFQNLSRLNYNTVYFQVRSNGQTFFNSKYEDWSTDLVESGRTPDYDPSYYAIELAKEFGLEIHAWVNVFRCYTGNNRQILRSPQHPINTFGSKAIIFYENKSASYWLDPGSPEVREYLVNLFTDLMEKYNFDGLHLDFMRYPGKSYRDEKSYELYGKMQNKGNWRRNNITSFVSALSKNIKKINPDIRIGAAPIGIYKNGSTFRGFQAYNDVYQDAESWLSKNLLDYIVPQIYWNMTDEPKFDQVADEWKTISGNKKLILGIAAYKNDVLPEMDAIINYSRTIDAHGIAFFRYQNIADKNFFNSYALPVIYQEQVFSLAEPPAQATININSLKNKLALSWIIGSNEFPARYFAVYNGDPKTPNSKFVKLVPGKYSTTNIPLSITRKLAYNYSITSIDENWGESENSVSEYFHDHNLATIIAERKTTSGPLVISKGKYFILMVECHQPDYIKLKGIFGELEENLLERKIGKGINIFKLSKNVKSYEKLAIDFVKCGKRQEVPITN